MDTQTIVLSVAIILILLALMAFAGRRLRRSRALRERFGPGNIRPLDLDERERYAQEWANAQERFVDEPATAAVQADRLVTALMSDRGYPTEPYEMRTEALSVEHAGTLDHYREAHDIVARDNASTERLRQAMTHYRVLFDELLEPVNAGGRRDTH